MNKSKRRSTCGRRRSRSLGTLAADDVCKTIDKSCPPAERLQMLVDYALGEAFTKADQEIDTATDNKIVAKATVNFETKVEAEGLFSSAVASNKNAQTDVPQPLNRNQYQAAMARLNEELKQWDEITAKERENLDKEINLKNIELKDQLNVEELNLQDYSNILEDISYMDSNISYQVSKLKSNRQTMNNCAKLAVECVDDLSTKIDAKIESYFEATCKESPKTLIKGCFE